MLSESPAQPDNPEKQTKGRTTSARGLSAEIELPATRAFVVHLNRTSAIDKAQLEGSAEHIESGKRRRFRSVAELLAFFDAAVAESERQSGSP